LYKCKTKKAIVLTNGKTFLHNKGVIYASIKIFNNLPPNLLKHYIDRMAFRSEVRKFLVKNAFYSTDEILSSNHDVD
jgi:hypothetical protein